jgi:hypothetical protein
MQIALLLAVQEQTPYFQPLLQLAAVVLELGLQTLKMVVLAVE